VTERITPASRLRGRMRLPGDKSISHRYAMLGAIAEGTTLIRNYAINADCNSTLECLHGLGVPSAHEGNELTIGGYGLEEPVGLLDAGNSGSTIRMLSGILAAQPFTTRITGDESLSRRPMERIMRPLEAMGASIRAREGRYPPLEIRGGKLHPIDYTLPVASAQVKTCVLFAGLYAEGVTTVRQPVPTRDHTELAVREFGADIEVREGVIAVRGPARLRARELEVPGDLSAAAFFLVAALLVEGSELVLEQVGLNPTRAALLDFLTGMGADIRIPRLAQRAGELVGDLVVRHSRVRGGLIEKALAAALIDEIPVLAVLGAASEQGLTVRDAAELRVKETDRIATLAENLQRMGVAIEVHPDGFHVSGGQRFHAAELDSFGDHRIAMAAAVAALAADGESTVTGAEAAAVSYPDFFRTLASLRS